MGRNTIQESAPTPERMVDGDGVVQPAADVDARDDDEHGEGHLLIRVSRTVAPGRHVRRALSERLRVVDARVVDLGDDVTTRWRAACRRFVTILLP